MRARDGHTGARKPGAKELTDYGLLPELLGRLPMVVQMDALADDQLLEILSGPPDSLVKEYQAMLALDDIKLEFEDEGLRQVVRFALRRKLGARGLRAILEEVCADLMFEAPERRGETITLREADVREKLAQLEDERFK